MAAQQVSSESSSSLSSESSVRGLAGNQFPIPVYGTISFKGHAPNMNDRWHVQEDFCRPNIVGGLPLHFFAVYDGHGSYHVSSLCKNMMHTIVAEELMRVHTHQQGMDEKVWEDLIQKTLKDSFQRMDQAALGTRSCDGASYICRCPSIMCNFSGSTANIVLLSLDHIIIANCGVSRVVLYRGGKAFQLSRDHKPTRQDELERIYAVGAKLINRDGLRVNGILNTTRAIGNHLLKRIVISEPEVIIAKREVEDEFLILASDGLWNVVSSARACEIVTSCLRDQNPVIDPRFRNGELLEIDEMYPATFPTKTTFAASVLAKLALARGSQDNITVIVIDLSQG